MVNELYIRIVKYVSPVNLHYKIENYNQVCYFNSQFQGRIHPGCTVWSCTPLMFEYMFIVCSMLEASWVFRQIKGALSIL